ncbi:MAG: hypothetical protein HYW01_04750 [Deltaproteobacteria bacterium]|nr:hypothetical protein [Deltaproteobacteria bacterium]
MSKKSKDSSMTRNEVHNESHQVPKDSKKTLRLLRDLQMKELQQRQRRTAAVRKGSKEERRLNKRLIELVRKEIPDLHEHVANIRQEYEANLEVARSFKLPEGLFHIKPQDIEPHPIQPTADGEFWWASTDFHSSRGIETAFLTDGLHFFGGINYDDDPLIHASTGAVAHFELHANRRPPSSSGRFASSPIVELFGQITGFTGYWHWLWAADDKWCKCWLHLKQTALQLVPHDFGVPGLHSVETPVVLASREEVKTLIEEENESRFKDAFLQGFIPMPPIEFGLANPNLSIWVQLEIRFDIQLEGWSQIWFSPERNPMGSVLLRHPQWRVQPL